MRRPSERDRFRLLHMLEAAREALVFAEGHTRESLDLDRRTQFALARALEIVGEAAGHVSDEFQARHDDIAWADIRGARNRLAQAYFKVDLDIVWDTVVNHLPPLIADLERILAGEDA